ncbi:hypothetical protein IXB28_11990 [Leptothoe kymatousa TAU-MAC 1615]|uniref:Uncharacterized protein n=1 Tax=Leptothoe kymatousa TAU-MAC 1615 TaxID=2364775 RepID=A0ABS5Y527_9CYAN|nr:hypothetical protein [Leptothoe kymatousa TAU-MAC 1615]
MGENWSVKNFLHKPLLFCWVSIKSVLSSRFVGKMPSVNAGIGFLKSSFKWVIKEILWLFAAILSAYALGSLFLIVAIVRFGRAVVRWMGTVIQACSMALRVGAREQVSQPFTLD